MVKLDPIASNERLYVRVARRISELVKTGQVKPGDRLPSERDLADMLNVSRSRQSQIGSAEIHQ